MKKNVFLMVMLGMAAGIWIGCDDGGSTSQTPNPALEGTVSITGDVNVGSTLTANTGSLQGTGAISYVWRWGNSANTAGANIIAGAVSETYLLVAADVDKYISVTVTRAGYSGFKSSTANTPVWPTGYAYGGTGPGGGIVFFYSATGFAINSGTYSGTYHYLEAAQADISGTKTWASSAHFYTDITGARTVTGAVNTDAILTADSDAPAAKACKDYTGGGKTDWFLPSQYELNLMYANKTAIGASGRYWSSSQVNVGGTHAWYQDFDESSQIVGDHQYMGAKTYYYQVRAVRAF
ncbi:hypothetical protein FACS1894190_15370 [Spirochaetia bacterium]|nr:hypothetical protein FACS1894190_15370 [Spirochaetia bacterium]